MAITSNMYICVCNGITENKLKEIIIENEITSMPELQHFGVCDSCSTCFDVALTVLKDCVDERYKDEEWYISTKENCHWDIAIK